ncbi:MAG: hypothetical protein H6609_15150 [Ignavibacteriales bacterium]|nr:hypothetical protein [Ignavibacteriales bacterium]
MHYNVAKIDCDSENLFDQEILDEIEPLLIENYLWMNNNYKPKVEIKLCCNDSILLINFKVFETEVTAQYVNINDPVYKDSCVEFFINPFPELTNAYVNFEINAIGTLYAAYGEIGNRWKLEISDIKKIKVESTLVNPFVGKIDEKFWEIRLAIPFDIFEKYFDQKIKFESAKSNFYKCGDETKYEHYGCWNKIISDKPNFHLPKYFGDLYFK